MFTFGRVSKKDFEGFIRINQANLYKIAYVYSSDEMKALSILKESILKGYKGIRKLKNKGDIKPYMVDIILKEAAKYININGIENTLDPKVIEDGIKTILEEIKEDIYE
ncbi:MAG: hypothetical protein RR840_02455 [Clostridium sp.]